MVLSHMKEKYPKKVGSTTSFWESIPCLVLETYVRCMENAGKLGFKRICTFFALFACHISQWEIGKGTRRQCIVPFFPIFHIMLHEFTIQSRGAVDHSFGWKQCKYVLTIAQENLISDHLILGIPLLLIIRVMRPYNCERN